MKKPFQNKRSSGISMLEVLIAMFILTVGVLSFIGVMGSISKSIRVSKAGSLASNLAQEKIESLKNLSYYRLLVTTNPQTATGAFGSFQYDEGYYPPEELVVGQIQYTRGVLVQKVTDSTGTLTVNNWYDADTGIKLITVYVVWEADGVEKKVSMTNLRDNPNRKKIDASFTGTVTSGSALQDVTVVTLQDPLLKGVTNASGVYSISVAAGGYELKASKRGYFPLTKSSTATAGASTTVDFALTQMGYGTVRGIAYLNNHLVISAICAAVDGDDNLEYVELYNPTESTFTYTTYTADSYRIQYVRTSDSSVTTINPQGTMHYNSATIYPHRFFLIASSNIVNGVTASTYYSDVGQVNIVPANRIPLAESGGIRLVSQGVYETSGINVDAVGWGSASGPPYGPAGAREGTGFQMVGAGGNGFASDETLQRMAYSTSTAASMSLLPVGAHVSLGNAYDSNANSTDWVHHIDAVNDTPNNHSISENPQTGTPATNALVFIDDGLSASSVASSTGAFAVTLVATGTWSVLISSSGWVYSRESSVVSTNGVTTDIGTVLLNSSSTLGYASGRVVTSVGVAIPSIAISASGGSDTTDANGYYRMRLAVGTFTIVANSNNANSSYTVGQATWVVVNSGQATDVEDIILYSGGKLRGFVTVNGTDALPGIPIVATETTTGAEMGTAISDSQGYFTFPDMPVDSYTLFPQLETGETAVPATKTYTVVSGSTVDVGTFTVSNAFGTLQGMATKNGSPITTGVLVMAVVSPNTIGTNPPVNNSTLRNGSVYYYSATADSEGNYSISLRAGSYNVYGWYTTFSVNTSSTTKITTTATVTATTPATVNFGW